MDTTAETMNDAQSAKAAMLVTDFVRPLKPAPAQSILLSPVDQIIRVGYVCFVLLFPVPSTSRNLEVYSRLKAGLSLTLSEIPLIGGHLTGERTQVKVGDDYGVRFVYNDRTAPDPETGLTVSYDELKRNNFPCSALDPKETTPVPIIPTEPEPPVMVIQATFIQGGLILTSCLHHRVSDGLAFAAVLKAWAQHTAVVGMVNGNDLGASIAGLETRSMDRTPLHNGLLGAHLGDLPQFRLSKVAADATAPVATTSQSGAPVGPLRFCVFYFSASRLAQLKLVASPLNPADGWISTNDALCALLWRHVVRARARATRGLLDFAVAVEARRRLVPPLPKEYLGNATFYSGVTCDSSTVLAPSTPLATVAQLIRKSVSDFDSAKIRAIIGLINSLPQASDLAYKVYDDPDRGFCVTSWVDLGLLDFDWGAGLGRADSVRVPNVRMERGMPWCGFFPRKPGDGGLEVLFFLEEPAVRALREDEEFMAFAEWRCR